MSKRGSAFFIMHLAHELTMTKSQLGENLKHSQPSPSYEIEEWRAYFVELNKKPEPEKDSPEELTGKLKNAFMISKKNKPKVKK